jgi:hypothetical protein
VATKFHKDVGARLHDAKSLYATYMRYTQSKGGWADRY